MTIEFLNETAFLASIANGRSFPVLIVRGKPPGQEIIEAIENEGLTPDGYELGKDNFKLRHVEEVDGEYPERDYCWPGAFDVTTVKFTRPVPDATTSRIRQLKEAHGE